MTSHCIGQDHGADDPPHPPFCFQGRTDGHGSRLIHYHAAYFISQQDQDRGLKSQSTTWRRDVINMLRDFMDEFLIIGFESKMAEPCRACASNHVCERSFTHARRPVRSFHLSMSHPSFFLTMLNHNNQKNITANSLPWNNTQRKTSWRRACAGGKPDRSQSFDRRSWIIKSFWSWEVFFLFFLYTDLYLLCKTQSTFLFFFSLSFRVTYYFILESKMADIFVFELVTKRNTQRGLWNCQTSDHA